MKNQSFDGVIIWKVVVILITYHLSLVTSFAQDYTQRLQQQKNGQGTVTIHESEEIDRLVNSAVLGSVKPAAGTATGKTTQTPPQTATVGKTPAAAGDAARQSGNGEESTDTGKKVMRGGYKVNGYRVQAFAGGNSRKDRQQAEQVGNSIKGHYPNVPIYVHFYSPRWICRVGNYRTYEEAHQMLLSLRRLGYNQATIVKGKIVVQY